jgi:hypothetical protein
MREEALELAHAALTGQFPMPGALADQPERIRHRFAIVQECMLAAQRARIL